MDDYTMVRPDDMGPDWTTDFDGKYYAAHCSPDGMTAIVVDRITGKQIARATGEVAWQDMARWASDLELAKVYA